MNEAERQWLVRHEAERKIARLAASVRQVQFQVGIAVEAAEATVEDKWGRTFLHVSVEKIDCAAESLARAIEAERA